MTETNPAIPANEVNTDGTEEQLRAEIESLKRQLEEQKRLTQQQHATPHAEQHAKPPSRRMLWGLAIVGLLAILVAFVTGYVPQRRRESMLVAEAHAEGQKLPTVTVASVMRAAPKSELLLPGSIQALTEAPVLARADGYVQRRYADIGDRVKAGQLLAEIAAPELDQQVQQAKATVEQARAGLDEAMANLEQARSNEELARVTADRWGKLNLKGAVSRQENDQYQTQYKAQMSSVQALQKSVAAAKSNIAAAEANLGRLTELQSYMKVRAPFTGVITQRNIDVGALVTSGSTLLYRIAQMNVLRTYINVPQSGTDLVRIGQPAYLSIPDLAGREFTGTVTRTAGALDPATRTLLTEVQVSNPDGALMPGMYSLVSLTSPVKSPPLLIPGDTLVLRPDGPQVALVQDQTVHFQRIKLGRDYGEQIEVHGGLREGQQIVVNPGDTVQEGVKVNPVQLHEKPAVKSAPPAQAGSGGSR
jgi:RND family efflux transporter MFP subunit